MIVEGGTAELVWNVQQLPNWIVYGNLVTPSSASANIAMTPTPPSPPVSNYFNPSIAKVNGSDWIASDRQRVFGLNRTIELITMPAGLSTPRYITTLSTPGFPVNYQPELSPADGVSCDNVAVAFGGGNSTQTNPSAMILSSAGGIIGNATRVNSEPSAYSGISIDAVPGGCTWQAAWCGNKGGLSGIVLATISRSGSTTSIANERVVIQGPCTTPPAMQSLSDRVALVYTDASNALHLDTVDPTSGALLSSLTVDPSSTLKGPYVLAADTLGTLFPVWHDSGTGMTRVAAVTRFGSSLVAASDIPTSTSNGATVAAVESGTKGALSACWAASTNLVCRTATVSYLYGDPTAPSTFTFNEGVSKPLAGQTFYASSSSIPLVYSIDPTAGALSAAGGTFSGGTLTIPSYPGDGSSAGVTYTPASKFSGSVTVNRNLGSAPSQITTSLVGSGVAAPNSPPPPHSPPPPVSEAIPAPHHKGGVLSSITVGAIVTAVVIGIVAAVIIAVLKKSGKLCVSKEERQKTKENLKNAAGKVKKAVSRPTTPEPGATLTTLPLETIDSGYGTMAPGSGPISFGGVDTSV